MLWQAEMQPMQVVIIGPCIDLEFLEKLTVIAAFGYAMQEADHLGVVVFDIMVKYFMGGFRSVFSRFHIRSLLSKIMVNHVNRWSRRQPAGMRNGINQREE
jgi:hypothetical protein